jgi:hypothetical protein
MGYNVNRMKARAEELLDGYEDARNEAFHDEFEDMFMSKTGGLLQLTEDDVQGFLDSFTFPDEDEWAFDQVQSELDDIADAKYEQMRDERMGI